MSCCFGEKGFLPFGILAYKYGFQNKQGFTWFICESFVFRDLVLFLVLLVPNSSRHLSRNTRKGMSSSDSLSLSTSSSESVESGRSRGRQVDEESTSSGGMVSGIPMETVREVREDPPEELAESN